MVTTSLRERMLMALRIRNMSPRTERIYIDLVARFSLHFHRSPDRLGLPEPLRDALAFARKVTSHEGRRRHMQYIGKLMRHVDAEPILRALDDATGSSRAAVARMHQAEAWRERLLADDNALTELVAEHAELDVQQLRTLVRAARRERTGNAPPRQTRALYKLLHDLLQEPA